MDKENKEKRIDGEIYKSLEGYFPERFDLSPEELEKQIETENMQREAALGLIGKDEEEKAEPEVMKEAEEEIPADETVSAEEAEEAYDEIPAEDPAYVEEVPAEEFYEEPAYEEVPEDVPEEIVVPEAESVENNPLLGDMDPLDTLLREMDSDDEEIKKIGNVDDDDGSGNETAGHKAVDWFFDFLEIFAVCLTVIIVVFSFFVRLTRVDGGSMNDTLIDGEYLLVTDFCYTPTVGDIVVVQDTAIQNDALSKPLVKRLIATAGQKVDISSEGEVTITEPDGTSHKLDQSFKKQEPYRGIESHYEVPEGCVFVMGDNRNGSTDSRDFRVGYIDERCIFGKAICRLWPVNTFKIFKNPYGN